MTLRENLGLRSVKGEIALEIEVEGENLPRSLDALEYLKNWRRVEEGSLRGECAEYVMRFPSSLERAFSSLDELQKAFEVEGSKIYDSYRAGIHVHINVQDLTPTQIVTFYCSYIILEEILINWCDPTRVGNHFCLSASDAEYQIRCLLRSITEGDLRYINTDDIRYSSINLKSLYKFGSLEFRALESTQDFDKVKTWCKMLLNIKEASLEYDNPRALVEQFSDQGGERFLHKMLKEEANLFTHLDYLRSFRKGVLLVQDIAYGRKWGEINLNIFKLSNGFFS